MKHGTILLALLLLPSLLYSQFSDEFDSTTLKAGWTIQREDTNAWHFGNGNFTIRTQPGALNGIAFNNVRNMLLQPVTNDDAVIYEASLTFYPWYTLRNAGILYRYDDDNYIRVSRGINEGHDDVWLEWELNGQTHFVYANAPVLAEGLPYYLRLEVPGGNRYRAYWSIDGTNWTLISDESIAFPTSAHTVGIQAANGDGLLATRYPASAEFHYFRVLDPTPVVATRSVPRELRVGEPWPSPMARGGTVHVTVESTGADNIRTWITDLLGNRRGVERVHGVAPAGLRTVSHSVGMLPRGVYFLHVESGATRIVRRIVVHH